MPLTNALRAVRRIAVSETEASPSSWTSPTDEALAATIAGWNPTGRRRFQAGPRPSSPKTELWEARRGTKVRWFVRGAWEAAAEAATRLREAVEGDEDE